jgi:uncharacterized protein YbaR (Trm112 family)
MPIIPELLELLRCPQTGQRLALAAPELLARLEASRRAGTLAVLAAQPQWNSDEPLEAVLVREDGRVGYPVQGGIPILLADHGFPICISF